MVTITINGKKAEREFQNMAQALAFAYQSGECYAAEKIDLVSDKKAEQKPEEKPVGTPVPGTEGVTDSGSPEPDASGKPLEEMTHKELVAYAKKLNINIGFFPKDADIIAAIRAAEEPKGETGEAAPQNEGDTGVTETPQNGEGNGEAAATDGTDNGGAA